MFTLYRHAILAERAARLLVSSLGGLWANPDQEARYRRAAYEARDVADAAWRKVIDARDAANLRPINARPRRDWLRGVSTA